MSAITILESGMEFGEYNSEDCFYIEKSVQYQSELDTEGLKTCEFVLLFDKNLLFVEAKSSCPNYLNCDKSEEKKVKYNEYINSIANKLKHSLQLYFNIVLRRYSNKDFSNTMQKYNYSNADIVFVVVVRNAEMSWLAHYKEKIEQLLNEEMRLWKIKSLIFLNEEWAKKKKLIK